MYRLILILGTVVLSKKQDDSASNPPLQRKTTLKWGNNGELSSIDMARILANLDNPELRECDLSCDIDQ